MTTPVVSIIIPCYNKQPYVAATIESALAQGDSCEVIVIDDGSTDGSAQVVAGYNDRIAWETGPNRGGSAARNRGLALAGGRYIQFLDADDVLPDGKIAAQLAALGDAGNADIAFCSWSYFNDDGRVDMTDDRRFWHDYDTGLNLLIDMWTFGGFVAAHAWLVPRALVDKAGQWDERLTGDDDGDFFGRLLARADAVHFVGSTHVLYRDPPEGSVSRNASLKSARSFWAAFGTVSGAILALRDDRAAKRAVLSRLRKTAYAWRDIREIVDKAVAFEIKLGLFDLSPSLPRGARWMIGILGIRRGLWLRKQFRR
jgi:glycosyltransferase involved in cell wall biosynthesis